MSSKSVTFETQHEEMIHDAQLDYYGRKLATASSDRTIKIFDVSGEKQQQIAHLKGHDGPVWQVAWAHPKFGVVLASCSYDGRVVVWKEQQQGQWVKIFEDSSHQASVNSLSWASHTYGLILAAAAADGTVSVFEHKENNTWERKSFVAHKLGCCAVSWGPDVKSGALVGVGAGAGAGASPAVVAARAPKRFVTGGCDNRVRVWRYNEGNGQWEQEGRWSREGENAHGDWVRDVAWAPSLGLPSSTIASCSEDKTVAIWTEDASGAWKKSKTLKFDTKVWRVSWSVMGNILAVSQGDNKVSLWKESVDGDWKNLSTVRDSAAAEPKEKKEVKE